jgi:hypothetical protein
MDPYLEKPSRWPGIHHNFISVAQSVLTAQLRPKYFARIEERVYIADDYDDARKSKMRVPNDEELQIHQAFLNVIDNESRDVVTVIEILSPTNKIAGSHGRESYEKKFQEVIYSPSHFVEIDLLRGQRVVPLPSKFGSHEYLIHISGKRMRPRGQLYPLRLPNRLPVIPIPLKAGDPDAQLDLQLLVDQTYDRAGYDLEIDYSQDPIPPLDAEMAGWADQLLRSKGLR